MKHFQRTAAIGLLALSSSAFAGVHTEDLSRCLVEKTSREDKTALVQWIFVAMAQHPSVSAMAKITPEEVTRHNMAAGEMFMRLLTETCAEHSNKAIKHDGPAAVQMSFQVLGQAAAGELFAHPDVIKIMGGMGQFLDEKKLEALGK